MARARLGSSSSQAMLSTGSTQLTYFKSSNRNQYEVSDPSNLAAEFSHVLTDLQSASHHTRSVRIAACTAALIETARERQENVDGNDEKKDVSPNEMFVTTLVALTSLESSLENKRQQQHQHHGEDMDTDAIVKNGELENTVIPLLEILQRILPYVAHFSNNNGALLSHQFGTLSRSLRLLVAMAYAMSSSPGGSNQPMKKSRQTDAISAVSREGPNALLRQILRTSTACLLVCPPSVSEKDLAKLIHGTLVPIFHDVRPKVRKDAWGCATEIIMAAQKMPDYSFDDVETQNAYRAQRRQRQESADFLWEYCHAVIAQFPRKDGGSSPQNDSKEKTTKLLHILRFLAMALPHADDLRIRIRFGESCLQLLDGGLKPSSRSSNNLVGELSLELVREVLCVLLSCIEPTEQEQSFGDSDDIKIINSDANDDATKTTHSEDFTKHVAHTLTFLLQHRPNVGSSLNNKAADVSVVFGKCLLACTDQMLNGKDATITSKLLAMKLLPNVLTSLLHQCEASGVTGSASGGVGTGGTTDVAEMCGSEFNRFISSMIPAVMTYVVKNEKFTHSWRQNAIMDETNESDKTQRVALESIASCVDEIHQVLQVRYRNVWGSILSGGFAKFVSSLAAAHLGLKQIEGGAELDYTNKQKITDRLNISDLVSKLSSWEKTLVSSLLRLHGDLEKDAIALAAVEYATSAIIRGMGLELFLTLVDFFDNKTGVEENFNDQGKLTLKQSVTGTTGGGVRDDRAWLLSLMKHSVPSVGISPTGSSPGRDVPAEFTASSVTIKTHLSFFQGRVLNLARRCDAASADSHRTNAEASIQKSRVLEVWALFPAFCVYPLDVKDSLGTVAKTLIKALGDYSRYPKLIPIICGGLETLTNGIIDRKNEMATPRSIEDFDVMSNISTKILPPLFKLVENLNQANPVNTTGEDVMESDDKPLVNIQSTNQKNMQLVETITEAIGQLARACPQEFLQNLFKKVVQRLLKATTEATENMDDKAAKNLTALRMCSLLGLGQALVASEALDDDSLSLLYRTVRPLVRTDEHDPRVQKRAYKALAEICERHKAFVTSSERLAEVTDLMVDSIVTCQVAARRMRLKCLTLIVRGFDSSNEAHMAVIPKMIGEVLLCLKDTNMKTRESAYELLLAMATARNNITEFFKIVLAALGAQTSHMRSAAVMALSRLVFEYARNDFTVQSLLPSVMQTACVLFDEASREVTKSVIGLVRVCVAAMTADQLKPLLPEVVGGLMKYNKGKHRFRKKIKIILKKVVRVYGYEEILPLIPEQDARLITHIRKLSERDVRRKAAGMQDDRPNIHNDFDNMMESDEDDSDDGRTFMTDATGLTKATVLSGKMTKYSQASCSRKSKVVSTGKSVMTGKNSSVGGPHIKAEKNGEILDMLDASKMARGVHFADARQTDADSSDDTNSESDEFIDFDSQGRLVIGDVPLKLRGPGTSDEDDNYNDDAEENLDLKAGGKRRRISKFESMKLAKAEKEVARAPKPTLRKRQSASSLGAAYKAKNAGGDVKMKGQKFEPYAYVPLNAKDYTKKNRDKAISKMGNVVRNNKRKRG